MHEEYQVTHNNREGNTVKHKFKGDKEAVFAKLQANFPEENPFREFTRDLAEMKSKLKNNVRVNTLSLTLSN